MYRILINLAIWLQFSILQEVSNIKLSSSYHRIPVMPSPIRSLSVREFCEFVIFNECYISAPNRYSIIRTLSN